MMEVANKNEDPPDVFQKMPLLAFLKFLSFCTVGQKKRFRCINQWFFETVTRECKNIFGKYRIKLRFPDFDIVNLDRAMERPYGLNDIQLNINTSNSNTETRKEVLSKYKDNIIALCTESGDEFLLQPFFEFQQIQRLRLNFSSIDNELNKEICEVMLDRHAKTLEEMNLILLLLSPDVKLRLPSIPKLTSLTVDVMQNSHLMSLIHAYKDTLSELKIKNIEYDSAAVDYHINIPNLKVLHIRKYYDEKCIVALMEAGLGTLEMLKLNDIKFDKERIDCAEFSKLIYLHMRDIPGNLALCMLKACRNTLIDLKLESIDISLYKKGLVLPKLVMLEIKEASRETVVGLMQASQDSVKYMTHNNVYLRDEDLKSFETYPKNPEVDSDEESVGMFDSWDEDLDGWSNLDEKEYFNFDDDSDHFDPDESFDQLDSDDY